MFDPGNLERAYGGNWDRKAYTEAYKNWAKDTNARFIENDNLKMSNPATQKAYQDALAAYANNDIPKLKEIMSAQGGNFSMKIAEALAGHGRTMFDKERDNEHKLQDYDLRMKEHLHRKFMDEQRNDRENAKHPYDLANLQASTKYTNTQIEKILADMRRTNVQDTRAAEGALLEFVEFAKTLAGEDAGKDLTPQGLYEKAPYWIKAKLIANGVSADAAGTAVEPVVQGHNTMRATANAKKAANSLDKATRMRHGER